MDLVRIRTTVDLIYHEGYRRLEQPLRKVAAVAVTDGGRPHARVGGLQVSDITGDDGQT